MVSFFMEPSVEILSYEEGEEILIILAEPLKEGEKIIADILVEDEHRNTLNVLVPFRARNNRVPQLVINELRTEYSSATRTAPARVESVEFLAKSSGNLGALRLFVAGHSLTQPVFEFPPAEIKEGEYIVLHLRTMLEGSVDETGDNLALSGGPEALPDARDFWVPGTTKLLRKTEIVYLVDQDDRIIDAVLLSENPGSSWGRDALSSAAEFIAAQRAWLPQGNNAGEPYILTPSDAIITKTATATRTVCRDETQENTRSAQNWYITATSGATLGKPNNRNRYNP
jgi:hypothetical protein